MARIPRPPVVAVMGHIDHGKSSLLDYLRKSSIVAHEAGGITQHLGAYVVHHRTPSGDERLLTFLDTPGHAAFHSIRTRGAHAADVVILVVSAEEGAKPQTVEAFQAAQKAGIPVVVAFSKIDKPSADLDRARYSLLEHGIYLEGLGGDIPHVAISSKTGEGVDELLELVLLTADLAELAADPTMPARGIIVEAHHDERRGIAATLLVHEGTLRPGAFVVAGGAWAPVRSLELPGSGDHTSEATPAMPVVVRGFSALPPAGSTWEAVEDKRTAMRRADEYAASYHPPALSSTSGDTDKEEDQGPQLVPVVIKADTVGTLEAVLTELPQLTTPRYKPVAIHAAVGPVTESDIQRAVASHPPAIVVGFGVEADAIARELATRHHVPLATHQVIYELFDWLTRTLEQHAPRRVRLAVRGKFRILTHFSSKQNEHLVGGVVMEGRLRRGHRVRPRPPADMTEEEGARLPLGTIASLQRHRQDTAEVQEGDEFGAVLRFPRTPEAGEVWEIVEEEEW